VPSPAVRERVNSGLVEATAIGASTILVHEQEVVLQTCSWRSLALTLAWWLLSKRRHRTWSRRRHRHGCQILQRA
jgi:hypothetical protein